MSAEVDQPVLMFADNMADGQDGDAELEEELNGNPQFSKESSLNRPVKEGRIFKKAKRSGKLSPKADSGPSNGLTIPPTQPNGNRSTIPFSKNSRKSRSNRGRGLPKKGGAGGKGVWGTLGSELNETGECKDSHDPNYDSDSQDAYVVQKVVPQMQAEEVSKAVAPIVQEYLEHGDSEEVVELLHELNMGPSKHKIVSVAIDLALERHDPHRELISRLISDLLGPVLSQEELITGFDEVMAALDDLTLDTPEGPKLVGQFMARAVADDCLPPIYVTSYKGKVDSACVRAALEKAEVLLSMNHGLVRLDSIWGVGGGNRPVRYLTNRIVVLLKEYLNSGDISEASRCLKELDVPHFHHELVYQAAAIAIEESTERAADVMVQLLKALTSINIITPEQFTKGVRRVYGDMPDICLDVPAAYSLLDRLGSKMTVEGLLSDDLIKEMPVRGRKRFVSEGDGGKVKPDGGLL